jgi:hypothetical protein
MPGNKLRKRELFQCPLVRPIRKIANHLNLYVDVVCLRDLTDPHSGFKVFLHANSITP